MIESLKQYPLLWVLVVVILVIAIALFVLSGKNRKKRDVSPEAILSQKDLETLKKKFQVLEAEKLRELSGSELMFAIITNLDAKMETQGDEAFQGLNRSQQYIYALWYFAQTVRTDGLCGFFAQFGSPLSELVLPALTAVDNADSKVDLSGWLEPVQHAYEAYDENNEEASCDKNSVNAINAVFEEMYSRMDLEAACDEYIKENLSSFTDK